MHRIDHGFAKIQDQYLDQDEDHALIAKYLGRPRLLLRMHKGHATIEGVGDLPVPIRFYFKNILHQGEGDVAPIRFFYGMNVFVFT